MGLSTGPVSNYIRLKKLTAKIFESSCTCRFGLAWSKVFFVTSEEIDYGLANYTKLN